MIKDGLEVLKALSPPRFKKEKNELWAWLVTMGLLMSGLHILLACGLLPGFSGFAYASDLLPVQSAVVSGRQEFLEGRAFELRVKQCEAIDEGKSPQVYTVQLQEVLKKYYDLTKMRMDLPACQELK